MLHTYRLQLYLYLSFSLSLATSSLSILSIDSNFSVNPHTTQLHPPSTTTMSFKWNNRRAYHTRAFDRVHFPNGHPFRNTPLPPPSPRRVLRPRGDDARGHEGAQFGEEWDTSELPDPDDDPLELGELLYPDDIAGNPTTHVRSTAAGGYVDIIANEDYAKMQTDGAKTETKIKAKKEKAKRERRRLTLGAARRRWVWRNGKPGGKGKGVAGPERRRDDKGRFLRKGF